ANFKSVLPVVNVFPKSKKSRFDVALFYTGGKDSSYLLYYLSVKLKLNVLALTWEIPYISISARRSIDNAKKMCKNVEFIERKVNDNDLHKIYSKLYALQENTCACPSLAYILFYPELVSNKVEYFIAGNEPVQLLNLYYNHFAPKAAYNENIQKWMNFGINVGRVLTLRKPLRLGQFHSLMTMRQLVYGDSILKKISGFKNQLVSDVCTSIKAVPNIIKPLKRAIFSSNISGNIPAFVQVDLNDITHGNYDWRLIKELISKEIGWVGPTELSKGLHTSCDIEKCKEYSQFIRFYEMKSEMIPFSAIEISIASQKGHISMETALEECKNHLGFSLVEVRECKYIHDYLNIKTTLQ
ncbi:MAG: hypothetical protein PHC62_06310, partial [Candidatus Izemoplasmatales bacterium]|nr:hypothetical protein [Candidatus Izemoplasmatales bacterium]